MCEDIVICHEGEEAGSPDEGKGVGQGHFVFWGVMRER